VTKNQFENTITTAMKYSSLHEQQNKSDGMICVRLYSQLCILLCVCVTNVTFKYNYLFYSSHTFRNIGL